MIPDAIAASVLQSGIIPRGTRVQVFRQIYWVFLGLGTLVGAVVIGYMLKNAYKYRYTGGTDDVDRPQLGEVPSGGGKGKKLFTSLTLSAIIVISLIAWTYGTLLFVETSSATAGENVNVEVEGYQFGWEFTYLNNSQDIETAHSTGLTNSTLRIPEDRRINIRVTSSDVFHNFGIPELRVKTDSIPGENTITWFEAPEAGKNYTAKCYELCGRGHSYMTAQIQVMEQDAFDAWYQNKTATVSPPNATTSESGGHAA